MVEIQVGSKQQPLNIVPRIDGKVVTQSDIKTKFSNFYVNDTETPLNFTLEYKTRDGTLITVTWDSTKSGASNLWFLPQDTLYATVETYTALVYWIIGGERVYIESMILIDVKELHNS